MLSDMEVKQRRGTVCYLRKENKILLASIEYSPTWREWNGIGGYVEESESLEDTVAREILEETYIAIDKSSLRKVAELYFHDADETLQLNVFFANKWSGEIRIKEPSLKELPWFSVDEIPYAQLPKDNDKW